MKDRHIIWSNENLDLDDWREDLQEQYPDCSEDELYRIMCETNADYLSDERVNLNIQLSQPILVIADLGLWNGRRMGYKEIPSGNIRDCLSGGYDYTTWYVDKKGDFRCDDIHHDGTNHYLYRVYKDGVSEYQKDRLKERMNCLHSRRKQRKRECLSAASSGTLLQTKRLRKRRLLMFLTLFVPCVKPGTIWIRR